MMFNVPLPRSQDAEGRTCWLMDEPDSQFPAIALLVHDDEMIRPDIARAPVERHACFGSYCSPRFRLTITSSASVRRVSRGIVLSHKVGRGLLAVALKSFRRCSSTDHTLSACRWSLLERQFEFAAFADHCQRDLVSCDAPDKSTSCTAMRWRSQRCGSGMSQGLPHRKRGI